MDDIKTVNGIAIEPTTPDPEKQEEDLAKSWLAEIAVALRREKVWRKDALSIVEIYEGVKSESIPFNILYSNTETLNPALYNEVPRPAVKPRFKDSKEPKTLAAARVGQRLLEFLLDGGENNYPAFDTLIKSSVLGALLPGRGITRFRYDAETSEEATETSLDLEVAEPAQSVDYETVCGENVPYGSFVHGFGRTWKDVPFVAFEHLLTREELEANFGKDKANLVPISTDTGDAGEPDSRSKGMFGDIGPQNAVGQPAQVWEIWDKVHRRILFISPAAPKTVLKSSEDELKLAGFYPCPKPLMLFAKLNSLLPTPLYKLYQQQARELNAITVRIRRLIEALKVRGFYDSTVQDIDKVLKADDNTLIPVANAAQLTSQGQKLENAIFLMPLDKIVVVLQQLYTQRTQVKAIIFEITGIADIMRGASQASETLGAQELKNQWGTLRLKRMQKEVAGYCRDALRIMLEIAVAKLDQTTIAKMTGLQFPTNAEKAQAQFALDSAQQQQAAGMPPVPGSEQQLAMFQEVVTMPTWEEILGVLQSDTLRSFNIDIETNSTVDVEATEDKKDLSELLNSISQFLNGVAPLIESGTMPFEVAQGILTMILRRFRMGDDVEDLLKNMKPPAPQDDGKAAAAKQQMEQNAQIHQQQMQADTAKQAADAAKQSADQELSRLDMQLKQEEHRMKMEELARKEQMDRAKFDMEMQKLRATTQASLAVASSGMQMADQKQQHQATTFKQKQAEQKAKPKTPA